MAWNDYTQIIDILNERVENNELISAEYFDAVNAMLQDEEVRERLGYDIYRDVQFDNDFFQFEKLHPILRNFAASQYMQTLPAHLKNMMQGRQEETYEELRDAIEGNLNQRRRLEEELEERAMNPLFRLGCSLMSRADWRYTYYDDLMTNHIMRETLRPMDSGQIQRVTTMAGSQEKANEMIAQNIEKQVQLARTLLMAHIGNTYVHAEKAVDEGPMNHFDQGFNELKTRSVASMMSHCSRTAFVLPAGENVSRMVDSAIGMNTGAASGNYWRAAATHSTENGAGFADFKEVKHISIFNQRGMDIAIGGFGNIGIHGNQNHTMQDRLLKNDGSCGHMYMRVDKGGKNKTSSLLIGFESDSPSAKQNQQGHTHTASAAPEYMSSFLGQRTDEFGDKYGGRRVDLTGYTPDQLSNILDTFSDHYRALLIKGISDPEMAGRAMLVGRMLSDNPMGDDARKLSILFNQVGIEAVETRDLVTTCLNAKNRALSMMDGREREEVRTGLLSHAETVPPIEPLKEMQKPGLWVRFKAAIGIGSARTQVEEYNRAYQACQNAIAAPTTDPMIEAPMPRDIAREGMEAQRRMLEARERQRSEIGLNALLSREDVPINHQRVSGRNQPERQMDGMENQ